MILTTKEINDLKKLKGDIDFFRKRLEKCDYNNERKKFFNLMHSLWDFISNFHDEKLYDIFEHTKYFSKHKELFSSLQRYYFRTLECMESILLLTNKIDHIDSHLLNKERAKQVFLQTNAEIRLVDFSDCKTLIMVGTGSFPETILYIYENTSIDTIIGIDKNQEAVYIASELVKAQNVKKIKFLHYNGENYDYGNTDVIFVANFCFNKRKIFERIAKTAKPGTKILARNPVLFGRMFYEDTVAALHPRLALIKKTEVNKFFLIESLLIKKLDI